MSDAPVHAFLHRLVGMNPVAAPWRPWRCVCAYCVYARPIRVEDGRRAYLCTLEEKVYTAKPWCLRMKNPLVPDGEEKRVAEMAAECSRTRVQRRK